MRPRISTLILGRESDPRWSRPGLLAVLVGAAVAYTWALDASGYGNEYYAAAAYSGSESWTAWLFGSFDSASFISVDKPPVSLWMSGLSVRVFGLSPWSVLLPQALAGVATVAVLHHTIKRWKGHGTALLAAGAMAITPVVVVMFRYNNPDALLTLLLAASLAVTYSAVERGSGWRLAAAGTLVGFAFLTKTTQALLVVPAIAVVYLVCAPVSWGRRILHGLGCAAAAVTAAGWWVVLATTSDAAPYAGQTRTGSFVDYILGINGLDRLGGSSGLPGNDPFGGTGGWGRLFNAEIGGQISWLIPMAVGGVLVAVLMRPPVRERAGWVMWGTVFATHFIVFSLMSGVFHPYYSMTMAPAIAALAAAGATSGWSAWRLGESGWWILPVGIVATSVWAAVVLGRTPDFMPWLGPLVVAGSVAVAVLMVWSRVGNSLDPGWSVALGVLAVVVCMAAPAAYGLTSIGTDFSGGDPKAGPGEMTNLGAAGPGQPVALPQNGPDRPDLRPGEGDAPQRRDGPAANRPGQQRSNLTESTIELLTSEYAGETWLVATIGTRTAAQLILATGEPVMAMGGFSGGDPTPTSGQLEDYISSGELRFVLLEAGSRNPGWTETVERLCVAVPDAPGLFDCAAQPSVEV